jgi:hypothetical protein
MLVGRGAAARRARSCRAGAAATVAASRLRRRGLAVDSAADPHGRRPLRLLLLDANPLVWQAASAETLGRTLRGFADQFQSCVVLCARAAPHAPCVIATADERRVRTPDGPARYMDQLAPDRVAVVFDGERSWQSRRDWIEQARALAEPRAALLAAAADALQAEATALAQADLAADHDQALARLREAQAAASVVAKRLTEAAAAVPAEQAAFAQEIFGALATTTHCSDGSSSSDHGATAAAAAAQAAYPEIERQLVAGGLNDAGRVLLHEKVAASHRASQRMKEDASSAKRLVSFPSYKANRKPSPELVAAVLREAPSLVRSLGWPTVVASGIEADDAIGQILTLCCGGGSSGDAAAAAAVTPYILSKDKDFTQLLDSCPDLQLIRPRHWKATAVEGQVDEFYGLETVTAEDVAEK